MLSHPDWLDKLRCVHPTLRGLFPLSRVTSPQAGRIQKFLINWKMITNDPQILNIVKGWEIPLLSTPHQGRQPHDVTMNSTETAAADREVESMLAKGAIREAIPKSDQFVSNFFVTPKKEDNQYRPIINLKEIVSVLMGFKLGSRTLACY